MSPEDHRYEVRRFLYSIGSTSADASRIQHGLRRWGVNLTEHEITGAAMFLAGLNPPQVEIHRAALGSSQSFQITSAGQLAYERNE
jgi:hypothetical protein